MVGLNFADSKEAAKFDQAVEAKLHEREKKASECCSGMSCLLGFPHAHIIEL